MAIFGIYVRFLGCKLLLVSGVMAEAVRLANSCSFALSSCAHSGNEERAAKLCQEFQVNGEREWFEVKIRSMGTCEKELQEDKEVRF